MMKRIWTNGRPKSIVKAWDFMKKEEECTVHLNTVHRSAWDPTHTIISMGIQATPLTSILESLCQSKKLGEALRLVLSHIFEPRQYLVYSKILQLCTEFKLKKSGQLLHSRLIADGFPLNNCLSTRLVLFYSKIGVIENARKVFDQMPDRSVVSWTALISGYYQNGDAEEALKIFSAMHRGGVKANQFTYGSVLGACSSLLCINRGKQIQGCVQKGRYVYNLFVQSALIDMHSKGGKMEDAWHVFESMGTRDLVSWNTMIEGYALWRLSDEAILVFRLMLREGMLPDSFSLRSVLRASAGSDDHVQISVLHGCIIQFGFESHKYFIGSLIDAYAKCGNLPSAHKVYKNVQHKDTISSTALITGYAREGTTCTSALQLFNEVHRNMEIDSMLLCSMLNVCANTTSLSLGRQLHAMALKYQNKCDVAMHNALIDMYSKSGVIKDAKLVFDEMDEKNTISWTSLISGYGKHGYGHEAIALYEKMKIEGIKPNDVTFLSLLFACSHNGLTENGWKCFGDMICKHNILPRAEHYSCLVDLFARAGYLEEAHDLMHKVPTDFNASVWGAILGSCSTHDNLSLGEKVGKQLFSMKPENPVNYVVLSSIYAAAGLWDCARETRKLMDEKSSFKYPGHSIYQSTSKMELNAATKLT